MTDAPDLAEVHAAHQEHRGRHWHERLMMLCDGVFAISITLLGVEITVPAANVATLQGIWAALAPQLDAYALSFVVISVYWLAHRRFTTLVRHADAPMTVLTLVTLGLVALLPAATRLAHSPPARLVYSALVVAIGASLAATWGYAALIADLVPAHIRHWQRWYYLALMLLTPPFFLALTMAVPNAAPGVIPLILLILFLIGWRLRLRVIRRFGGLS